jgi:hypothetical protein
VAQAVEYLLCKCEGPDVKPQSHLKEKTKQNKKKLSEGTGRNWKAVNTGRTERYW